MKRAFRDFLCFVELAFLFLFSRDSAPISFKVTGNFLQRVGNHLPLATAHEFAFCDSFDQVALQGETNILSALPKEAKVKSTENRIDGDVLVVYSLPGEEHTKLLVSLLKPAPGQGYTVASTDTVTVMAVTAVHWRSRQISVPSS